jgi:hypothetical protein
MLLWLIYMVGFVFLAMIPMADFFQLIACYSLLFIVYFTVYLRRWRPTLGLLLTAVVLSRLPFFFHLPQLSDDFYRFLWDGLVLASGYNPFGMVPLATDLGIFSNPKFAERLLAGMNSAGYGSVYPPLHQGVFWIGATCSGGSLLSGVNAMRGLILLAEVGMAGYFLRYSGLKNAGFIMAAYLLNPLVVAEGIGNVHMEALMLPLLAVGLHRLLSQKTLGGSLLYAGSVLVKLTPVLLAPLLFFRKEEKSRGLMAALVAGLVVLVFLPFKPWVLMQGWEINFGLYFQNFEFNASVYYLLREAVTPLVGYNPISYLGPALGILSGVLVLGMAYFLRKGDFYTAALYSYLTYYLLATTVHPWYLIPVVYLALAANRPVWLVWSFAVWLSYSHYLAPIGPKWGWLTLEYGLLFTVLIFERRLNALFGKTIDVAK